MTERAAAIHLALGPGCRCRNWDALIHESTLRTVEYQHGMQMSTDVQLPEHMNGFPELRHLKGVLHGQG
jgi:hypothetical protein